MAQGSSRKRRKQRRKRAPTDTPAPNAELTETAAPEPAVQDDNVSRGYARGRAKDEAARAALKPLAEGERPRAVALGAFVAGGLALAEVIFFAIGFSPGEESRILRSVVVVALLGSMAWGMWNVRYWAVLGMQTLLGITIVFACAAAMFAANLGALVLVTAIILPAGALFWFLVKSMARIQMPERPGAR